MNKIIILFFILDFIFFFFSVYTLYIYSKSKKEENLIKRSQLLSYQQININDLDILKTVISKIFENYKIIHFKYKDDLYITSEMQKEMVYDILDKSLQSISDDILNKLSFYYKKEYIKDIMCQEIQIMVLEYTISINGTSIENRN